MERLERRYALRILLLIRERGPFRSLKELVKNLGVRSFDGPSRALENLKDLGLIKAEASEDFPFFMRIELTPLGREVAEKLAEIEAILAGKGGEGS